MKKSSEKKLISLKNKELIDKLLYDYERVNSLSASAIIESCITKTLLPHNKMANLLISNMYLHNWKSNKILQEVYFYLASGINWNARYTNSLPLVKFSYELELYSTTTLDCAKEDKIRYIISGLESIKNFLEHTYESKIDSNSFIKDNLNKEIDLLSDYIGIAKNHPDLMMISNIYRFIINNWSFINDYTKTYRLLGVLEDIRLYINDTSDIRCRLIELLKDISNEWDD